MASEIGKQVDREQIAGTIKRNVIHSHYEKLKAEYERFYHFNHSILLFNSPPFSLA